jgi:chromosome segregation ATPase
MASPTYDDAFVDELLTDVDAYLNRLTILTDFAESQVEERIRLAALVNRLASDRDGLLAKISELEQRIESLDARLRSAEGSLPARLLRAPRKAWRAARRSRS